MAPTLRQSRKKTASAPHEDKIAPIPPAAPKARTKKMAAAQEELVIKVAPGFKPSKTLTTDGDISSMSKFHEDAGQFGHTLTIYHRDAFTLKPITITDGPLKGRQVLLLEPFTDYFDFMGLPPEIRQIIYEMLFEDDEAIKITTLKPKRGPRRAVSIGRHGTGDYEKTKWSSEENSYVGGPLSALNLMAVSKQLRRESAPVMYGNVFQFCDMAVMQLFLENAGSMRQYLRYVHLDRGGYIASKGRSVFDKLRDAKGLREIALHHRDICAPFYYRGRVRVENKYNTLVADCKTMMLVLRRAQTKSETPINILDIITVYANEATEQCYYCRHNMPQTCMYSDCGLKCGANFEEHRNAVETRVRKLMAKALNIDDETDD